MALRYQARLFGDLGTLGSAIVVSAANYKATLDVDSTSVRCVYERLSRQPMQQRVGSWLLVPEYLRPTDPECTLALMLVSI